MIINANALHIPLKDATVQCCVTSPPYYGLRDYGTAKWEGGDPECDHKERNARNDGSRKGVDGFSGNNNVLGHADMGAKQYNSVCPRCGAIRKDDQIGLEPTPDEYVAKLVQVFREVKRVLKDDGVLWMNLGDSYASLKSRYNQKAQSLNGGKSQDNEFHGNKTDLYHHKDLGFKDKDLLGIPWMVAFALRADGWYLRSDIIWSKPNPMPESVKDRPTKAHEYLFLLAKSQKYYYDNEAIFEPASDVSVNRPVTVRADIHPVTIPPIFDAVHTDAMGDRWVPKTRGFKTKDQLSDNQHHGKDIESYGLNGAGFKGHSGNYDAEGNLLTYDVDGVPARNKRTVWTITTQPFRGAHFAVMPEKLVEPCILAGSRPGDVILDPFSGSGTVGVVAQKLGRGFVGIELNPEYVKLAETRMMDTPVSLFNQSILEEL